MECKYYCVQNRITSSCGWCKMKHNITYTMCYAASIAVHQNFLFLYKKTKSKEVDVTSCQDGAWKVYSQTVIAHSTTLSFLPGAKTPGTPPGTATWGRRPQHHIPSPGWKLGQGCVPLRHKLSLPSHRLSMSGGVAAMGCLTQQEHISLPSHQEGLALQHADHPEARSLHSLTVFHAFIRIFCPKCVAMCSSCKPFVVRKPTHLWPVSPAAWEVL